MSGMTYTGVGVNYDAMDPYKRMCQLAGLETDRFAERFGFKVLEWTRGESVFVIETPMGYVGFVIEGLGTKNLVADAMYELRHVAEVMEKFGGKSYYDQVAQCNVAMAVNDMATLGVLPVCYGQYAAVGDSRWFEDATRARDLVDGTKRACTLARCVWGGGETPTLKGMVNPSTIELAGGTWGIAPFGRLINPAHIRHGDVMVLIGSSGIHANYLTMARKIAEKLSPNPKHPELGYLTMLPDGRTYGETLLDPTHIYVGLVEDCFNEGVDIHYAVNVTGHGLRKLMRAKQPFTYVVELLGRERHIFPFIQKHGPIDDQEAWSNMNMGVGFALYVRERDVHKVLNVARELGFEAWYGGHIEEGEKRVVIEPKGIEFKADTLSVR